MKFCCIETGKIKHTGRQRKTWWNYVKQDVVNVCQSNALNQQQRANIHTGVAGCAPDDASRLLQLVLS